MKRRLGAAALLGATTVAGFAPAELFPLPIITLAVLFKLWEGATVRRAVLLGYAWGLGFFLTGVSWIYVSLHDVGDMPLPIAALATVLLCAYLALYPALAGYGYARLKSGKPLPDALLLASLWTLTEFGRGYVLTGLPWLALGYSQTPPSPLAGFAPIVGSYGLSWLVALLAALLPLLLQKGRRPLALAGVLIIAGVGADLRTIAWTHPVGTPFSVSLLQGNIPQSLKWDPQRLYLSIDSYVRLARDNPAQLTVLPETAIPIFFDQIPTEVVADLTRNGPVLLGSAARLDGDNYSNSAFLLTPDTAQPQSYAKRHLVPFGEYVPPGFDFFMRLVNIPLSGFTPGGPKQAPMAWNGQTLMPNICYEDLFGEEIRDALQGENAATVLINLSNTAWFGHSLAQPQHLQIARLRALETGRPMLRATNTGMTAAIEPNGWVSAVLPPFTQGALKVNVQGYQGATPYVRFGNVGPLLLVLLGLLPSLAKRVVKSTNAESVSGA
ncbi:MAG TPA: apolipoprotein N-acyltransferase [Rhodocyclaceae bacterium]|nr:apolipoprotein N-acyltransferase [Rhodocyclaceae bacterium]